MTSIEALLERLCKEVENRLNLRAGFNKHKVDLIIQDGQTPEINIFTIIIQIDDIRVVVKNYWYKEKKLSKKKKDAFLLTIITDMFIGGVSSSKEAVEQLNKYKL